MGWEGPYRIRGFLNELVQRPELRPPDSAGIYVLSQKSWKEVPDEKCGLLYVGQSQYLRFRMGELFSDLLGVTPDSFDDEEAYKHRGRQADWHWHCLRKHVSPPALWIGWYEAPRCLNRAEINLFQMVRLIVPGRPTGLKCERHGPVLDLATSCPFGTDSRRLGKLPRSGSQSNGTREPPSA